MKAHVLTVAALLGGLLFPAPVTSPIDFVIDGHEFRVAGGNPGDIAGFACGFDLTDIPLPNGSVILIQPLLVFGVGNFGKDGSHAVTIGYDGKMLESRQYHFQAFSARPDGSNLTTSERRTLDFRSPRRG